MKTGVWVKEGIGINRGGAYSYQSKLLELIDNHDFSNNLKISFITSDPLFQSKNKEIIRINNVFTEDSAKSSSFKKLLLKTPIVNRFIKRKAKSQIQKSVLDVRRVLEDNKVDVIYYLTQASRLVPDYPFISTNWDVGHLSTYLFPEFYDLKSRANRIYWYSRGINDALAVISESESGKKELINYTNINPDRVFVVPMFPGDIVNFSISKEDQTKILEAFDLIEQKFFFYPAQFWAHKNHYNLIQAFKIFNKEYPNHKLVLTGSDKGGNLNYILEVIREEKIESVSYLGFVDNDKLYTFYKNAVALIMPTFLGPTNMPPLEAISLGCPVICSNLDGHKEQLHNAALYIDPLDQNSIYEALVAILHEDIRNEIILKSKERLKISNFNQDFAIKALEINLKKINKYRSAWKH